MSQQKTWFVTGTSQGLGLELVKKLLEKGDNVAATARNSNTLKQAVNSTSPRFLPLEMDLLSEDSIKIDCLVNSRISPVYAFSMFYLSGKLLRSSS